MVDLEADMTGILGVGLVGAMAATTIGAASKVMYKAADEEAKMLKKKKVSRAKLRKIKKKK